MTWAGTTLAARRAERRERLLEVGLELLGTQGSAAVTVRSVCRRAKLTDRYFYENFADREDLLLAVYDQVAEDARAALVRATAQPTDGGQPAAGPEVIARAAVEEFLAVVADDPRKGRVLLLEPMTDSTLGRRGGELMPLFADLVGTQLDTQSSPMDARMTATAIIGALTSLFTRWLDGSLVTSRAELTEFCVRLLMTSSALAVPA